MLIQIHTIINKKKKTLKGMVNTSYRHQQTILDGNNVRELWI